MQKHQAFEAELNANESRLDAIDASGKQLIDDEHYASEQVQERLDELHELWQLLFSKSKEKGERRMGSQACHHRNTLFCHAVVSIFSNRL